MSASAMVPGSGIVTVPPAGASPIPELANWLLALGAIVPYCYFTR
jgi:hypothetical protein